jgi:GT2 family glycosyltransferase
MNPILMCAYNNLELTKKAVASVLAQDIPVEFYFIDNGSTDGTWEWIQTQPCICYRHEKNISPLKVGNDMFALLYKSFDYILGIPNDVILPPNCYRELLRWPRGFVCASDNGQNMPTVHDSKAVSENTPMAVMLVRKWAYDAMIAKDGYFMDEGYFMYASDCDLALRMASCGIRGVQLDISYWHYGSASHRLAPPAEGDAMRRQADRDRAYFVQKWGFRVDSLEYGQRPNDLNFQGACK